MKVATLEKFHLRGGNQDPGDPGVGKVRGGWLFFQAGGGNWPWMTLCTMKKCLLMLEIIEFGKAKM